jgi:processive 1,2-diacylglycerol beta-glucosyltransferase
MIVSQIVPGQEEGNYELLRRHDAGVLAPTPAAITHAVQEAFAHNAAQWRRWRQNLRALARPTAARDIAQAVLEQTAILANGHAAPIATGSSTSRVFEPAPRG